MNIELDKVTKADDEFQAAVVRQFGKKRAGDMRYDSREHNVETAEARKRYHAAIATWHAHLDATR